MSMIPSFFGRRPNVFHPFSDEVWDPFQGWPLRFPFDQGWSSGLPSSTASFARAQVDWKETPTAHVFQADVPGLRKEEVKVEVVEGRILQIRGERKLEQERRSDTWHHVERSSGRFARRFRLPENAKVDQLKVTMENGVLTVTVPKQPPPKKAVVRSIEISG